MISTHKTMYIAIEGNTSTTFKTVFESVVKRPGEYSDDG